MLIRNIIPILITVFLVVGSVSGCGTEADSDDSSEAPLTGSATEDITTSEDTGSAGSDEAETIDQPLESPASDIPSGSIVLFTTLSGGTQTDFLSTESGNINWDTTHYKLLRYVPAINTLDEFGWTSSKSYAKSYIYGITNDGWLYEVKCFTETGRKDITRKDPETGETIGSFGSITTSDRYAGFTIHNDKLIYRTKINKDLLGNRTGGGNLMVMNFGETTPTEVFDYYDENNQGGYYGIGDDLVSIVASYEDDAWYYDIYRVDPVNFTLGTLLYSFGSYESVEFFSGDTCLFWSEDIPGTDGVYIVKFTISESAVYFLEITETIPQLLSVDESNGKVLITFKDPTPESPFYYLADLYSGAVEELDITSAFFSNLIHANGQFWIID